MAAISKAALAELLSITRPRISQYVSQGMPVRPDGKLDLDKSLNWIVNHIPLSDDPNKGSAKAAQLVQHGMKRRSRPTSALFAEPPVPWLQPVHDTDNEFDAGFLMAAIFLAREVRVLAQIAAFDAGCDREKAIEIGNRFYSVFAEAGSDIMTEIGVGPFATNPEASVWPTEPARELNWDSLEMQRAKGHR